MIVSAFFPAFLGCMSILIKKDVGQFVLIKVDAGQFVVTIATKIH